VRYSLHVAYPDGSGVYEVGQTDAEEIAGIQWTPDGKRLTFFARNTLYSVPVGKP
jgi:hypothetical protein